MFLLNPVQGSDLQRIIIPQASLMAIFVYPPSAEITIDILKWNKFIHFYRSEYGMQNIMKPVTNLNGL